MLEIAAGAVLRVGDEALDVSELGRLLVALDASPQVGAAARALGMSYRSAWGKLGRAERLLGVALVEQPLPAAEDDALAAMQPALPLCADESCHTRGDLDRLCGRYQVVNIKLEKTGGLSEALALRQAARQRGLRVMVGCMLGTSLAMAPATLVAQGVDWVDLDGPLLIGSDRQPGLRYEGSRLYPGQPAVWG